MMLAGAVVGGGVELVDVLLLPPPDAPELPLWPPIVLVMRLVEVVVERTRLVPRTTVVKTDVMTVTEGEADAVEFPLAVGCAEPLLPLLGACVLPEWAFCPDVEGPLDVD